MSSESVETPVAESTASESAAPKVSAHEAMITEAESNEATSVETAATEADSAPDSNKLSAANSDYGIRIELLEATMKERELRSFEVADEYGNVSLVTAVEKSYETTYQKMPARVYSFDRKHIGVIRSASFIFDTLLLCFVAAFMLTYSLDKGNIQPGIFVYLAYGMLLIISVLAFRVKGIIRKKRVELYEKYVFFEQVEKEYGNRHIYDLPAGAMFEAEKIVCRGIAMLSDSTLSPSMEKRLGPESSLQLETHKLMERKVEDNG